MNRQFSFALCLCLLFVAFTFEPSIVAQKRRPSRKRPVINNPKIEPPKPADPGADELANVNKEIQNLCASLHRCKAAIPAEFHRRKL